jgi:hypothetical protein
VQQSTDCDAVYLGMASRIDQADYALLSEKVKKMDLGLRLLPGMSEREARRWLGAPEGIYKDYELLKWFYSFPPGAIGPRPKERHRGSFSDLMRSASYELTVKNGTIEGFSLSLPTDERSEDAWSFITLNGKPLAGCWLKDLTALLGQYSSEPLENYYVWCYAPIASPELPQGQYVLVSASFKREGGKLDSITIRADRISALPAKAPPQPAPRQSTDKGK